MKIFTFYYWVINPITLERQNLASIDVVASDIIKAYKLSNIHSDVLSHVMYDDLKIHIFFSKSLDRWLVTYEILDK